MHRPVGAHAVEAQPQPQRRDERRRDDRQQAQHAAKALALHVEGRMVRPPQLVAAAAKHLLHGAVLDVRPRFGDRDEDRD